jgi:hypothetical protein
MKDTKLSAEDKKWQCECDLRTLKDAVEIFKDKDRIAAVKKEIKDQRSLLDAVESIDEDYLNQAGFKTK